MQDINNIVLAVSVHKKNVSPKSFMLFTKEKKSIKSQDWKIWDMFECICTKHYHIIDPETEKEGKVLMMESDSEQDCALLRFLRCKLDAVQNPETKECRITFKQLLEY